MTKIYRVFLADDHVLVRDGVKSIINAQPDMSVVGEADDGPDTIAKCRQLQPDVVITDISMAGMNGAEVTRQLSRLCPSSKTLVLTMHESAAYLRQMLEAGASGYVIKRSSSEDLLHGIRSVADGGTYIDPRVAEKLAAGMRAQKSTDKSPVSAALSEREMDVIRMTAEGYTSREIAQTLNIGKKSVDTYKSRAMSKLGLESRTDIVRYAMSQGWLS